MQFKVTGSNHATGARMTLQLEAASKADAERKARQQGMDVNHVAPVVGDETHHSQHRGDDETSGNGFTRVLLLLVILGVLIFFAWKFALPMVTGAGE
jgi:type II secretory pathway component PulF